MQASPTFKTKSVSNTVLMSAAPVLSLDKVVVPYWDRRLFTKFGFFLAVTWLITVVLKPKVDYDLLLNFVDEKKQQISSVFSDILSKSEGLINSISKRIANVDISSWRQFTLKKVTPINSSYSLYQFSAGIIGRLDGVDIGQEVTKFNKAIYTLIIL